MATRKLSKVVNNWEELTKWIESINPYKHTVVLSGWVNRLDGFTGKTKVELLVFNKVSVDVLGDVNSGRYDKKPKRKMVKRTK